MIQKKGNRLLRAALIGSILGAVLSHSIGLSIRSDNLPFFEVLGVIIGLLAGSLFAALIK